MSVVEIYICTYTPSRPSSFRSAHLRWHKPVRLVNCLLIDGHSDKSFIRGSAQHSEEEEGRKRSE